MIAELLTDGVLETLRKSRGRVAQGAAVAVEWLREVAAPPEGVELRSRDGAVFSGLFVIDRNRPVMAFAVRHPTPDPPMSPPSVQRPVRYGDLEEIDGWGRSIARH